MEQPARRADHRLVRRVAQQDVLEDVARPLDRAALQHDPGLDQLAQIGLQELGVVGRHRAQQLVREFATEHGRALCELARAGQACRGGGEEVAKAAGTELVVVGRARLDEHARDLLDEERYALGVANDLVEVVGGQRGIPADALPHERLDLRSREAGQMKQRRVPDPPRRREARA